jgi:hypothetical protein
VAQALAGTVAAQRGAASRDALTSEESLLEHFGVYYDDELPAAPEAGS